ACLAASALLPVHAAFDVPAHRIALVLTSLLLFALANPPSASAAASRPKAIALRAFAVLLLLAALGIAGRLPGLAPLLTPSSRQARSGAATRCPAFTQPVPQASIPRLMQERLALAELSEKWQAPFPLEPRWRSYQALSLLPFEDRRE